MEAVEMGLTDRQYFTLRRLHSLSGIVPIGVFLLNHFLTNSFAIAGAKSFNDKADFLRSLPYLYLIEIFGIFLPIAFHAIVGVIIFREARFNTRQASYRHNFLFTLQRITGLGLIAFITYHVLATRFAHWFGIDNADLYALMYDKLQNPWIFLIYVAGIVAASYHLGNGLFGFAIHWGLATSRDAQRRMATAGLVAAALLAVVGLNALLGFKPLGGKVEPIRWFIHQKEEHATTAEVEGATHRPPASSQHAEKGAEGRLAGGDR
jgi:succinate dehydrogenase / fumarate reductase cytochrome b subunit